jgi:hypothetical protein
MSDDALKETPGGNDPKQPFRSEFAPLIDELYREEVLDARKMSPDDKFLAGEELFRLACEVTLAGIRDQNPAATEAECRRILEERLRLGEWLQRNP